MLFRKFYFVALFWLCTLPLCAQILNDSVKNVYGTKTTLFLNEESAKYNKAGLQPLDTLLNGFHQFTLVDRLQRKYQDLGNPGTQTRPVFYSPPTVIGQTSGYHGLDPYFVSPERVRYFDTKSPYSKLFFVVGDNGRTVVDIDYSRNVKPNWNVGAAFQRFSADKQMDKQRRGDKHSEITAYHFFTRYFTKDKKYHLMANFSRMGSSLAEQGGARHPADNNISNIFDTANPWLNGAFSSEARHNLHLFHEYKVSGLVQLYHSYDRTNQKVGFTMANIQQNAEYLTNFKIVNDTARANGEQPGNVAYFDQGKTNDESRFLFSTNEVGFKGNIDFLFYNFYFKRRDGRYAITSDFNRSQGADHSRVFNSVNFSENYAGFNIRNDFSNGMNFAAFGEYLLGGNYRLGSSLDFKYLEGKIERVQYAPTLLQQSYVGNHIRWNSGFTPIVSDNLYGAINIELPFLKLKPHFNLHRVSRYVYFGEDIEAANGTTPYPGSTRTPNQANGDALILSPAVDLNLNFFKNFYFENQVVFTGVTGQAAEAIRIPDLFVNSRLFYANFFFNKKLQMQFGLDMHYRSSYYAYGYEPVIQQFFLQNDFAIPAYPLADVFLNLKISNARVFLKFTNMTQAVGVIDGYFSTPYYTGQRGAFDFGINWLFFD